MLYGKLEDRSLIEMALVAMAADLSVSFAKCLSSTLRQVLSATDNSPRPKSELSVVYKLVIYTDNVD